MLASAKRMRPTDPLGLPHLSPIERAALAAFLDRVHGTYGADLHHVVLFGSKARGDFGSESDLDVLVVLGDRDRWSACIAVTDLTTRLLVETGVNISALVCGAQQYQGWREHHAPILNSVWRDGVEVWTAPSEPSLRSA